MELLPNNTTNTTNRTPTALSFRALIGLLSLPSNQITPMSEYTVSTSLTTGSTKSPALRCGPSDETCFSHLLDTVSRVLRNELVARLWVGRVTAVPVLGLWPRPFC